LNSSGRRDGAGPSFWRPEEEGKIGTEADQVVAVAVWKEEFAVQMTSWLAFISIKSQAMHFVEEETRVVV